MARQFMLARMFSNVVSTSAFGYITNWGGFSISNTVGPTAGLYWDTASTNAGQIVNPFNPMERGGFYPGVARAELVVEVTETTTNSVDWDFVVRTRSPIAAGYSFVQQRPVERDLTGFIDCIDATNFFGFTNLARMPVSSVVNTNQGGNGFSGYFGIPISPGGLVPFSNTNALTADPTNSTVTNIVVNLGDDPSFPGAPNTPLAYSYEVPPSVTRLTIEGTGQGNALAPLQIVATNNPGLTNVVLSGSNPPDSGRRVYLHFRASGAQTLSVSSIVSNADWRLGMSAQNDAVVDLSALSDTNNDVRLVGGIRTAGQVLPASDAPVTRERDPQGLDFIADQMMWLEDYRAP
jgi:hypothetical protein